MASAPGCSRRLLCAPALGAGELGRPAPVLARAVVGPWAPRMPAGAPADLRGAPSGRWSTSRRAGFTALAPESPSSSAGTLQVSAFAL